MKRKFILFKIVLLIFTINTSKAVDTLKIKQDVVVKNSELNNQYIKGNTILKEFIEFDGYLYLEIDPSSISGIESNYFRLPIYWVNNIGDVDSANKFYYISSFSLLVENLKILYNEDKVSKLNALGNFYSIFTESNEDKLEIFQYKGNGSIQTNDIIETKIFFRKVNGDSNTFYAFYKFKFDAAVLEHNFNNETNYILWPVSYLKEFRQVFEYEVTYSKKFEKKDIIISAEEK